jgi:Bacterial regulatory proteins, luxR family
MTQIPSVAAGRSNAGIAAELFVEPSTVKTHLIHLYSKLGVHSRTQAVARARARCGCWADTGRGVHPASPTSGGRAPPATPPS